MAHITNNIRQWSKSKYGIHALGCFEDIISEILKEDGFKFRYRTGGFSPDEYDLGMVKEGEDTNTIYSFCCTYSDLVVALHSHDGPNGYDKECYREVAEEYAKRFKAEYTVRHIKPKW